ncbi:MAG: hypothetical protein JSW60_00355 [Thermoplasmatales archaeon]|nr:MAG: hypothetical protein JSW60_00355 [Thermoplasmatales archaeon]
MNKKILIGSIIAVAILVGVSFTSVVGYSGVKSNVKASPLFTVRTKRAIDEESRDLTCEYVGKREEITIPITTRNNRIAFVLKVIERIRGMDDGTFNKFVDFLINRQGKRIKEENIPEMINVLHQLKINPDEIKNYIADEKENKLYTEEGFCETVGFIWIPECWKQLFLLIILNFIWLFYSFATIILDCQ